MTRKEDWRRKPKNCSTPGMWRLAGRSGGEQRPSCYSEDNFRYIEFYDVMSVPMAIALTGQMLLGQQVMVKPSEAEKNLVQSNVASGGAASGGARKLYVGNLHANITEDQLRQDTRVMCVSRHRTHWLHTSSLDRARACAIEGIISIGALLSKQGPKYLPVARSFLSDALRLEPTNRMAWFYLGNVHKHDGRLADAVECGLLPGSLNA